MSDLLLFEISLISGVRGLVYAITVQEAMRQADTAMGLRHTTYMIEELPRQHWTSRVEQHLEGR